MTVDQPDQHTNLLRRLVRRLRDGLIQPLTRWHGAKVSAPWLQPLSGRGFVLIAICAALAAVIANVGVRQSQLSIWKANPDFFYVQDIPLFATTDASYYTANAQALKRGQSHYEIEAKRLYPNRTHLSEQAETGSIFDAPLLSVLIATLSPSAKTQDIMLTAHALIPITAAITALAILFALGVTGYWLEAAVAAIGGGLSASYLVRSGVGRIDTDQLNLGFFYLLIGLVVVAARSKDIRKAGLFTLLAALTGQLFLWWYQQQEFLFAAFIALLWLSFLSHVDWRRTAFLGVLFWLCSGAGFDLGGANYIADVISVNALNFPNAHETITELRVVPLADILTNATGNLMVGIVCLIGLGLWALRHPVLAVAYGPLAAFGLLNFLIGNRAIFYSAPILWFGGAWLLTTAGRALLHVIQQRRGMVLPWRDVGIAGVMGLIAGSIGWVNGITDYVPRPSFPTQMMAAFKALDNRVDSENSVVASWWDYGYASMLLNGLPTIHDPGNQNYPSTHLVARALLADDQAESAAILRYLARDGISKIQEQSQSEADLLNQMKARTDRPAPDIYLVLTEQMGQWMGSISQLGHWNLDTGQPVPQRGNAYGSVVSYTELRCAPTATAHIINCNGYEIDVKSGMINDQPGLSAVAALQWGQRTGVTTFNNRQPSILQLHYEDTTRVRLVHESLYESTFNQLFHHRQITYDGFELVYDDYPHARIYRLRDQ